LKLGKVAVIAKENRKPIGIFRAKLRAPVDGRWRHGRLPLMIGLALTSISLIVYQVTLTRVFSPMFRYHYVFLLTSLAMFGLGIGGMISYKMRARSSPRRIGLQLPGWLLILASSFIASFSLIYKLPFVNFLPLYALVAAVPFTAGGIFIALVFMISPERSYRLYFADLLGAGVGGALVVLLLNSGGVVIAVIVATALAAGSSLLLAVILRNKMPIIVSASAAAFLITIAVFQPFLEGFGARFTGYFTSPWTNLFHLQRSGHTLEDTYWDSYSRTDILDYSEDPSAKIMLIDGVSPSKMFRFDGNLSKVADLRFDLRYMPFVIGPKRNVLLIGPGGGRDVLLALLAGSGVIDAVEVNAGNIRLANEYGSYNGSIYEHEKVTVTIQDGRNYVRSSGKKYDLIYLAKVMTEAAETVGYSLAENFIYTKEAISDYWSALTEGGSMAFVLHEDADMTRLILTAVESMYRMGIPPAKVRRHFAVVRAQPLMEEHDPSPVVIIKKAPFEEAESTSLLRWAEIGGYLPLYLPGVVETGILSDLPYDGTTDQFYRMFGMNLTPTTDNRPFFFDFEVGVDTNLWLILGGVALVVLIFFKPSFKSNSLKRSPFYFMGLGVGFMLIEISLMQMTVPFLGHPIRAFLTVLISLLLGAGSGSLAGGWQAFRWKGRYLPLLIVSIVSAAMFVLILWISNSGAALSLPLRVLLVVAIVFPLGFFMGMPFPFGLKAMKRAGKGAAIGLIWGLNGVTAVGGSALAVVVSMKIGFSYSLWLGSSVYLLLFWLMPLYERSWRRY
jgi:hypothetical protein